MHRRAFLTAAAAILVVVATGTLAQEPGKVYRLAVADVNRTADQISEASVNPRISAFMTELRELGWIEGQSLEIERWRLADRPRSEWGEFAQQIVTTQPDVIFANGTDATALFSSATDTVPIVFNATDPIGLGVAESLARPGGNATGVTFGSSTDIDRKRVQILRDTVPDAQRFAYLTTEQRAPYLAEVYDGLDELLGIRLVPVIIENPIERRTLQVAFEDLARLGTEALVIPRAVGFFEGAYVLLAQFASSARMPTMRGSARSVELGLLVGYDLDAAALGRGTAGYVDRVLKGADPAVMPIQEPTEFILPINLNTAREIGVTTPPEILAQATELIE